jgi:rRNA maturation RNase YbeY
MIDVELLGGELLAEGLTAGEVRRLCALCAARMGLRSAHVAVELVSGSRIAELNSAHRGQPEPTDVLSFPIDGRDEVPEGVPRALGDVVLCPQVVGDEWQWPLTHGLLHLLGYDHGKEMEAREEELLS